MTPAPPGEIKDSPIAGSSRDSPRYCGVKATESEALALQLRERATELLSLLPSVPAELIHALQTTRQTSALADITASVVDAETNEKQALLEMLDPAERVKALLKLLSHRLEVLRLSKEIGERTKEHLDDHQR